MKAVVTVVGRDTVGILAKVAGVCAETNVNVEEVTQSILSGTFAMIMVVDVTACTIDFAELQQCFNAAGEEKGVDIKVTRQELYDAMHHI
ncbi:MAG: ACT domain-containing protein [Pygmaiobacter sp.]|nr:ACT domain-containing protein [Pygmaiobacter sp.]